MDEINLDNNVPENIRDVFVQNKTKASCSVVVGNKLDSSKAKEDSLAGSISSNASDEVKKPRSNKMENEIDVTKAVREEVTKIFAEKDAEAQAKAVETKITALETEKSELAKANAALTAENQELKTKEQALATEKEELLKKNESLVSELAEANKKADEVSAELGQIKKDQTVASRKEQLSSAGLLLADEALLEKQIAKISDMTDEQFAEYVSELQAIASKLSTEKEEQAKQEAAKAEAAKAEAEKATASAKTTSKESIGDIFNQAMASAQSKVEVDTDNVRKYAQF